MMNKICRRHLMALSVIICQLSFSVALTSCSDDETDVPLNFYSSVRLTAAGFIEADDAQFSDFRAILNRNNYLSMLKTYGNFTVFVPTNEAVQQYLKENGLESIDQLSDEKCDTLARTHIVSEKTYFTTDMGDKVQPKNMNEDYLEITSEADSTNDNALMVYVNKKSRLIEIDDSVTNGVVHVINNMIHTSSDLLPTLIESNPNLSLFYQAMKLCNLDMLLTNYYDDTYKVDPDSAEGRSKRDNFTISYGSTDDPNKSKQLPSFYPMNRYFKYTVFVETNEVFKANGINDIEDLKKHAKEVYDLAYPNDAGKYDEAYSDRRNPLNRFISYHMMNRVGTRDHWVMTGAIYKSKWLRDVCDCEEYFETMAPHTVMRFCRTNDEVYINRKGFKTKAEVPGVRILRPDEEDATYPTSCPNGRYLYVDNLLEYSADVRNNVLNRRMRFDNSSLSPDFMNAGGRFDHMDDDYERVQEYKNGYLTDFKFNNATTRIGLGNEQTGWVHYGGSGIVITGEKFDASLKLPPVPHDGTYEVRIGYSQGDDRGIAQFYLDDEPCGLPVSFRMFDGNTGWVGDITESDDPDYEEINRAQDKAMRNRWYMKAPDSYGNYGDAEGWSLRKQPNTIRRILVRKYMFAEQTYWLRFRQLVDGDQKYMSLDYLELCPKDVFDSPEGEDWH